MHESLRVLYFEDDDVDAHLFENLVKRSSANEITLQRVKSLAEGVSAAGFMRFDAILLDLGLPDSMGLESLRAVRQVAHETPIVVLTGMGDTSLPFEALRQGAQDYLVKGQVDADRLTRAIRFSIERVKREAVERELAEANLQFRAAREVQQNLWPSAPRLPGYDIAGRCLPADETGGDFYDFFPIIRAFHGIALGDVSGHGSGRP